MKMKWRSSPILFLCIIVGSTVLVSAKPAPENERGLITKMIDRGKALMKTIPKMTVKIAGRVWDFVPSPRTIFNLSKQALIGLPQEVIAYAVNSICSAAVHVKAITPSITPNVHEMNFEMLTRNKENITIPLLNPEELWNHRMFKQDWDVVLLITGWNSNINETNDALDVLFAAYRLRKTNFVVFDTGHFVNSLYTWSAFNTEGVGRIIGEALAQLSNHVDTSRIHLIGEFTKKVDTFFSSFCKFVRKYPKISI